MSRIEREGVTLEGWGGRDRLQRLRKDVRLRRDALGYEERFERTPEEGEDFVVLEDPEGNLFCVIDINA